MFHYDRGMFLTAAGVAVDVTRRQPRGFVSHAHSDHMARHELALCTPPTAKLYLHKFGKRSVREMPFGEPHRWGEMQLTALPAGHCLGSAMLHADDGERTLLYTGDFKLVRSLTSEPAEPRQADLLVIESTYGRPNYRLPPRAIVIEQLIELVANTLRAGATPVIESYVLGKSQEVTKILTSAGIPVLQHPLVWGVSEQYRACGVDLGDVALYDETLLPGRAVVVPPSMQRAPRPRGMKRTVSIAVSGWAVVESTRRRFAVDHALPLSDHADYDELLEMIDQVAPRVIYCTHGPEAFVGDLRSRGLNAHRLEAARPERDWEVASNRQTQLALPLEE